MTNEVRADSAKEISSPAEPRWGLLTPLLTAGLCPTKTARRTDHLGKGRAIATHLLAWLGILVILPYVFDLQTYDTVGIVIVLAAINTCYIFLAIVFAAWGARRERLQTSLGRSVHRSLRHTPHLLQAFLLASLIAFPLFRADAEFERTSKPERHAVQEKLRSQGIRPSRARRQAKIIVRSRYPLYIAHGEECGAAAYCLGGLWFLWGWLSAIGSPPLKRSTETEGEEPFPLCSACGYNLTGLSMEGRCPECGEGIMASLGPDARPGTPWQQRSTFGRWGAFWRTTHAAFARPTSLGRQLIPSPDGPDNRSMVWLWGGCNFLIAWLGWLVFSLLEPSHLMFPLDGQFIWMFCPFASYALAVAALLVCVASAGLVGLFSSWKHKRNMLPAMMQAASTAAGFGAIWLVAAFSGWIIFFVANNPLLTRGASISGTDIGVLSLFLGPTLMCIVIYDWLIGRIARGARFANR